MDDNWCANMKIAIVGAGPAGFYTASRLLDKLSTSTIDMFEALPVPFGLARYGVAPDHPEVKNCQEKFEDVAQNKRFGYYGNVEVGKSVSLKGLQENYNALVFAYGASEDRKLGIRGENLPGVFSARQFVNWYNGHPDFTNLEFPLHKTRNVVVVGLGNVGLDVARMLLCDPSRLKTTDIAENAYETLKKSTVENVALVGRRGLLQSAFTTKELRELINEPGVEMEPLKQEYIEPYEQFISVLERPKKRLVQVLEKGTTAKKFSTPPTKKFSLNYLLSPEQFYANGRDPELLSSTKFCINRLEQTDIKAGASAIPTSDTHTMPSELVFRSIGYKSLALPRMEQDLNVQFDSRAGYIPNLYGRIIGIHGREVPGLYAAGWVKNGPTGVIATTMFDSFEVAETMINDFNHGKIDTSSKPGFAGIRAQLKSDPVSWSEWQAIDKYEKSEGKKVDRPRTKIVNPSKMMELATNSRM